MEELTQQEQDFVKEVVKTGNKTEAVVKAYKEKDDNYAGVKGHRLIRKDKIQKAVTQVKKTLAERIDVDKLEKVFNEGLEAGKHIYKNNNESGEIEDMGIEPDYAVRHKYFDSGVKIMGEYAPDRNVNINLDANITINPKTLELAKHYEEELKKGL